MASGCATLRMCYVMQRFEIMEKVVFNVMFIVVMTMPCALVFSQSMALQVLGVMYCVFYVKNIVLPIYRRVKNLRGV